MLSNASYEFFIARSRERHRVYSAPSVKPGAHFAYFDPIGSLAPDARARWQNPAIAEDMIAETVARAGGTQTYVHA